MRKQTVKPDEKIAMPRTVREAYEAVMETFRYNDWSKRDERLYLESLELENLDTPDAVRKAFNDLKNSKMILVKE